MKKIKFIMIILLVTTMAHAQKGRVLVFGDLNYYNNSYDSGNDPGKYHSFLLAPGAGYGITECITLGVLLQYATSKSTSDAEVIKFGSIGGGLFARYNHKISQYFSYRNQLNLIYASGKERRQPDGGENDFNKSESFSASLLPSFGIHPDYNWIIELGFGNISWTASTSHPDNGNFLDDVKTRSNTFRLNFNASTLYFGVAYLFGCEKAAEVPKP